MILPIESMDKKALNRPASAATLAMVTGLAFAPNQSKPNDNAEVKRAVF
jgi:hypothetical protein